MGRRGHKEVKGLLDSQGWVVSSGLLLKMYVMLLLCVMGCGKSTILRPDLWKYYTICMLKALMSVEIPKTTFDDLDKMISKFIQQKRT